MIKRAPLVFILIWVLIIPCVQGKTLDVPEQVPSRYRHIQNAKTSPPLGHPVFQGSIDDKKPQLLTAGFFDASKVGPLPINLMVILFSILALVLTRQRN